MECLYELGVAGPLHSVDLDEFNRPGSFAYWCGWNHPTVPDPRKLKELIEVFAITFHWQRFIKPGDTCIDIGAHRGDTTVPMAVCAYGGPCGPKGTIVAIEPNTEVSPVLEINAALNRNIADIKLVLKAITPTPTTTVEIADHGNNNCNGGIIDPRYSLDLRDRLTSITHSKIISEGVRLDDLLYDILTPEQLSKVRFIKTDCEGFDKEIIRSIKLFLEKFKPTLFVEWFDGFTQDDTKDLFEAIGEIGYRPLHPRTLAPIGADDKVSDLILLPIGCRL